jgi:hypothetical protein
MTQSVNVPGVGTLQFPDGMSQPDMASAIQKNFPQIHAKRDPSEGMSGTQKFLAGAGKAFTDLGHGAEQLVTDVVSKLPTEKPSDAELKAYGASGQTQEQRQQQFQQASQTGVSDELRQQEAARRARDAPLMQSGAARAGNVVGGVAAAAPAALIPGANTYVGASLIGGALGAAQPTAPGESRLGNVATGAIGGAVGKAGGDLAAKGLGAAAASLGARTAAKQTANAETDAAITAAKGAGYRLPPSQAGGLGGKLAEGASGKIRTEQTLSRKNQEVTNDLAKKALGLPKDKVITTASLNAVRKKANQAYDAVANLGKVTTDGQYASDIAGVGKRQAAMIQDFPEAANASVEALRKAYGKTEFTGKGAVQAIRVLRADGTKNIKAMNDPEKNALGYAQKEVADALEGQLERHAGASGNPTLVKDYQAARQLLAKTHTVEESLNPATGNVSAKDLAHQLDRGAPLSGELKTIADAHLSFPKALQDTERLGGHGPFSALDYVAGVVGGAHNPAGAAAIAARPVARAVITSKPYQKAFIGPQSYKNRTGNTLKSLADNKARKYLPEATASLTLADRREE